LGFFTLGDLFTGSSGHPAVDAHKVFLPVIEFDESDFSPETRFIQILFLRFGKMAPHVIAFKMKYRVLLVERDFTVCETAMESKILQIIIFVVVVVVVVAEIGSTNCATRISLLDRSCDKECICVSGEAEIPFFDISRLSIFLSRKRIIASTCFPPFLDSPVEVFSNRADYFTISTSRHKYSGRV
jgi:hypothetical protein